MSVTTPRQPRTTATSGAATGKGVALRAECHIVDVPGRDDTWVIYFPLQSLAFLANGEAAALCKAMREGKVRGRTKPQRELIACHTERFDSCRDCFARWHCCGDCLAKAPDMNRILDKRNSFRCTVNRDITLHQLLTKLDAK